ncbi:MAG: aminotransferase class V-fold PLP-dependent enzyme [Vicinamibacterales bacterium]
MSAQQDETELAAERQALEQFLAAYPEYRTTSAIDAIRAADYGRLDAVGEVYLDYTGSCLYGASQLREHAALLNDAVLGNPHSANPSSQASTRLVEATRQHVLRFFNAVEDYAAIFTVNATGALKRVAESYPFAPGGRLLLSTDNHNSVNGIREFAARRGAAVDYAPLTVPDLRLDLPALEELLDGADADRDNLFAFPAQSNFSGVKHPLGLVEQARAMGWDVLLDAAAFVPTSRLDLATLQPDFVCLSFYKMFGYPTGVGCLLVHKRAIGKLRRPWFAGGTVNFASVHGRAHILAAGEAGFEDGTLNFLSIPAIDFGLRRLESLGLETINTRIRCLTAWTLEHLLAIRHANGRHMVRLYGPSTTQVRGGTITLNLYDPDGHLLDYRRVEELAGHQGISLRTGCFCNPGAGETAEGLTDDDMRAAAALGDMTLPKFLTFMRGRGGKGAGAIRLSFGLVSNFADAYRFILFVSSLRDQTRLAIGDVSFDIESCRVIRDGS